jgi:hypothetical protein
MSLKLKIIILNFGKVKVIINFYTNKEWVVKV